MRLRRALRMGLPELACRGRQAALKRLDRIATVRRPVPLSSRLLEELREPGLDGAAETLLARLRATCSDRFFAGVVSTETPRLITERMPAARDGAIAAAVLDIEADVATTARTPNRSRNRRAMPLAWSWSVAMTRPAASGCPERRAISCPWAWRSTWGSHSPSSE